MKTRSKKTNSSARKTASATKPSAKTVRPKPLAKPAVKTILVPTDFSPESRKAVRYAASLARELGGKVSLLHVVEPVPYNVAIDEIPLLFTSDEMLKTSMNRLKTLVQEEGIPVNLVKKFNVRTGPAYPEILDEAEASRADMIVIATHGYNALTRVIFGSTTERVVRHAKCPVLVVRENVKKR